MNPTQWKIGRYFQGTGVAEGAGGRAGSPTPSKLHFDKHQLLVLHPLQNIQRLPPSAASRSVSSANRRAAAALTSTRAIKQGDEQMLSQQGQKKFAWLHPVKSLAATVDHYELRELTWFSFQAFADGLINSAVRLAEEWLVFIQFLLKHASLATGSAQLSKKARNRWQVANGRVGILDDAQYKVARFLGGGKFGLLVDSESGKRGDMVEKMLKANQQRWRALRTERSTDSAKRELRRAIESTLVFYSVRESLSLLS